MLIRVTELGNEIIDPISLYEAVGYNTTLCMELDRLAEIDEHIYLTGSHFFGTATKDSDLDFFVGIGNDFGRTGYERVLSYGGYLPKAYLDNFTGAIYRMFGGRHQIDISVCICSPEIKEKAQLFLQGIGAGRVLKDLKSLHSGMKLRQKLWNAAYDICYVARRAEQISTIEAARAEVRKDLLEMRRVHNCLPSTDLLKKEEENLVRKLVTLGEWPLTSKRGCSAQEMWENYGIDWHLYSQPFFCSKCGGDLRDHKYGPPFKLENSQITNDHCVAFSCPHCGHSWS